MRLSQLRRIVATVATLALFLPFSSFAGLTNSVEAAPDGRPGALVPDQYIVTFTSATRDPSAQASGLAARYGLSVHHVYEHALKGFAATIPAARLAQLRTDPSIASITQDRVIALDQPAGRATNSGPSIQAQTLPTGIQRINGLLSSTARIDGVDQRVDVDVAVIDTGIQSNHPDLNVVGGYNCLSKNRGAWGDGNGHGTHVAGTIGALDNGTGVVGVAPGARLWAVRVLNSQGSGTWSGIICGIDWVTGKGTIEVANMSLGGTGADSTCGGSNALHNAICASVAANVTFVVAAGNSNKDANTFVPATYAEVITVSALADFNGQAGGGAPATCRADVDDTRADFSNFGTDVDLMAPGVCILSTWLKSGYNTISGTSMASPHVAGAAALYKATHPSATPAQVKTALQNAGTLDWNNGDDPDGIKEVLLNVSGF